MLRNHVKAALRHYLRHPKTAALYVTGLTLGISCTLLVFIAVWHETGYDAHQSKGQRIYRVETEHIKEGFTTPGTYAALAGSLRKDVPQIETVSLIWHEGGKRLSLPGSTASFTETVYFTDNALFNLLDFRWITGNAQTALSQPNSVVLTRSVAQKIFGTDAVLGKTMLYDNKQLLSVTGVLNDHPTTTNFPLDVLISEATLRQLRPDYDASGWFGYGDNSQVYALLNANGEVAQLTQSLQAIATRNFDKKTAQGQRFVLNPLSELHYGSNYSGRSASKAMLTILTIIGLVILLVACINFVNLTTAQASKRAKEIGVRKTIGSSRQSLAYQFLTEAGLITLLAVVLSVTLVGLGLPLAANLLQIPLTLDDLLTRKIGFLVLVTFTVTSLLAGTYPAFYLSGMAPNVILKPVRSTSGAGRLRQGLVIIQFTVALVLISSTLLMHRQLSFFQSADLGFNKNALVTVGLPDNKPEKLQSLRSQLLESAQLTHVSFSLNSPTSAGNWMENVQYRKQTKAIDVRTQMKFADAHYVKAYGISLLAGQDFREGDTLPKAIVNEVFLHRIGVQQPESVLGETVYLGQRPLTIIGVARNFNVNSLHQNIDPTLITYNAQHLYQAGIKLSSEKLTAEQVKDALAHIEKVWRATYPNQEFNYTFLDETLAQAYESEAHTAALIDTATLIAILISCLGLFGLAAFMAEQRTKEIGVRKVLGASVGSIVALLSKDFLKLVLIAIVIASPIAWYAMHRWLQDFAYKIDIEWWVFALAGTLAVGIALLTVSFQAIKAALMNPVKSLRSE